MLADKSTALSPACLRFWKLSRFLLMPLKALVWRIFCSYFASCDGLEANKNEYVQGAVVQLHVQNG